MLGLWKKNAIATLLGVGLVLCLPAAVSAQHGDFTDKDFAVGLKAGAYVPSLFNDLGPHVDLSIEGQWLMPFLSKRFAVALEAGWSPPTVSDTVDPDSRLGEDGSEWSYEVNTHQVFISLGPIFRIIELSDMFVPYAGLLGRVYMIRTEVNGEAGGNTFLENTERSTEIGIVGLIGGELELGPGVGLVELSLGGSDYPHAITGDTTTRALAFTVGYRLFL